MRFATLLLADRPKVVRISEDGGAYAELPPPWTGFDGDMVDLITAMSRTDAQGGSDGITAEWHPLGAVRRLAPVHAPRRNLFCIGKNYHEHAAEFSASGFDTSAAKGEVAPEAPIVFTKAPSTVIADGDLIEPFTRITQQLDYEAELAVVIGKPGRGIAKSRAMEHVFGYTIVNDVTARDLQQRHRQWFLGKSMDTFCPMGPWLVSADQLDLADTGLRCWVNGELRQQANTRDLIFDVPTIIETISAGITLQPGDIIATGTPAGVGIGFKPPRFLLPGDEVRIEIDGIGSLSNRVRAER